MSRPIFHFYDNWLKACCESEELAIAASFMRKVMQLFPDKQIFIVGGVPRDIYLGKPIHDVDMATNIPFEELSKHFELRNISKNDSQPVYSLVFHGMAFDLAQFRSDSQEQAGRHNNVAIAIDSFEEDTKRRDFTINAMGVDFMGRLFDYQEGIEDLEDGIIRTVGDPIARFQEDTTRILRAFRFTSRFGFELAPEAYSAAITLRNDLMNRNLISNESISKEFFKAAESGPALADFVEMLTDAEIMHDIMPEFTAMEGFGHDPQHHPEGGVIPHILACLRYSKSVDPVVNLAIFFHDFGKAVTQSIKLNGFPSYKGHEAAGVPIVQGIFDRLKFAELSAEDKEAILFSVEKHMLVHNLDTLTLKTLTKLWHHPSWKVLQYVALCDEASRGELFNLNEFNSKIERAATRMNTVGNTSDELKKRIKKFIDGNRLMELMPELSKDRPRIGFILGKVHDWLLENFSQGREPSEQDVKDYVSIWKPEQ